MAACEGIDPCHLEQTRLHGGSSADVGSSRIATTDDHLNQAVRADALRYLPAKVIPAFLGLATVSMLSRCLGAGGYGAYSLATATQTITVAGISGWLTQATLFHYSAQRDDQREHFQGQVIVLAIVLAVVGFGVGISVLWALRAKPLLAILAGVAIAGQVFLAAVLALMQSDLRAGLVARSLIIQCVAQTAGMLLLVVVLGLGPAGALLSVFFGQVVALWEIRRRSLDSGLQPLARPRLDFKLVRQLADYGLPMCVWFFAQQLLMVGDRYMIDLWCSPEIVGPYAALRDLSTGALGLLTMPLLLASHPVIMRASKDPTKRLATEELVNKNLSYLLLGLVPLVVVGHRLGETAFSLIAGAAFVVPASTVAVLIANVCMGAVNMYAHKGLEIAGRTWQMAIVGGGAACLAILMNIFAIPVYGTFGAACVTLISQIVYGLVASFVGRNRLTIRFNWRVMTRMALWAVAMEFLCWSFRACCPFEGQMGLLAVEASILTVGTVLLWATSADAKEFALEIYGICSRLRRSASPSAAGS